MGNKSNHSNVARQYKSASKPRLIALEPRMLFDGAAVATVVDATKETQNSLTDKAIASAETNTASPNTVAQAADTPIAIDANQIEAVASLSGLVDGALALAQPAGDRKELIVVDGSLENLQDLLDNISRIAPDKTLLVLDPTHNEVDQFTAYLQEHGSQFDAIHVLSHGGPGWISLNEQVLSLDALDQDAALWNSIKTSLNESGDLLLYGCNVADTADGQAQINALATFTGADIAASTDVTGQSGDWVLEATSGDLETESIAATDWQGDLWVVPPKPTVATRWHATYGRYEGAWWGDPYSSPTNFATYDDAAPSTPVDLVLNPFVAGAGATFKMSQVNSATAQTLQGVEATTYDQAVANNEYVSSSVSMVGANGIALSYLKYNKIASNSSSAKIALSLYDPTTGVLTRLTPNDVAVSGSGVNLYTALTKVGMVPGQNYELRFYGWGSSTVYFDNPGLYAYVNAVPTAIADTFATNSDTAVSGILTSNDTDPEAQSLSVSQINGVNLTIGSSITLPNGTLVITGANGAFTYTPNAVSTSSVETFSYTITDGNGQTSTATATINVTGVAISNVPTASVNNITVNEASSTAVFTVSAAVGQELTLAIADVTAGSADHGSSIEYSIDGGANWTTYSGAFNNALTGSGTTTGLLVRTTIANDTTPDNGETFTLTATPTGGTAAVGTATIKDDGSGTIFTSTGAVDTVTAKNNDITVSNITVNEGSQYAVFTIDATQDQNLSLALASGTASGADYGSAMQYSLDGGTTWTTYAGAFNNTLTGSGTTTGLLVRTTITNDTTPDNGETFTLAVTPTGGSAVVGTATIKDDGSGTIFTSSGAVDNAATKNNDITVNNITVNEASPYAVFTVAATQSQNMALALTAISATGAATDYGSATATNLQYSLDGGSTWTNYAAAFNATLSGAGLTSGLLVRTPITNDTDPDNGETFTLTATPTGGTAAVGTATIKDDGSGTIFTSTGAVDTVTAKNNDITVNNITVNEGSQYAVFTIDATQDQNLSLALASGTASGADYGSAMQYSLDGGTTWTTYTGAFNNALTGSGTTTGLLVRTTITNDGLYEMSEDFTLRVTATGGTTVVGTATITDDGSGAIFTSAGIDNPSAVRDDDRPVNTVVIDNITVNEASSTAVFTVSAAVGQELTLAIADVTAGSADHGSSIEYSIDGGANWTTYSGAFNNALTGSGTTTGLLVRTTIANDTTPDNGETFTLTATPTGGTAAVGTATIKDDGSGTIFTSTGAVDTVTAKNNDITVSNITVNEGSQYAVFTIDATQDQNLSLALASGTASGADYGSAMQYSLDGGTTWTTYAGAFNNTLTGSGTTTGLLVRTTITNDTTPDNGETFTLAVTPTGGSAVVGTATIKDDGSGTIFTSSGAVDNAATKNNDITVNNITVNEASPYAVFTVAATQSQNMALALTAISATGAATDYGSATATNLQYSLDGGSTWTNYAAAFNATLSGAGLTSGLLVRTPITNDTDPDNGETFTLTATPTGGTAAVGTATIKDDGSGTIFTSTGAVDTVTAKNNDITVNNITVNEGSQYAVFTIDATQDQNLSLALASGTASGADYGSAMQYSLDGGTTWTTYTGAFNNTLTGSGTTTGLLVRTTITNDTTPDNGETFTLAVTPTGGSAVVGTATIKDDGSGTIFTPSGAVDNATTKNNDITVNNITVNEASPYAVFTVAATQSQNMALALTAISATGAATDYGSATATNLQYSLDGGSTWTNYAAAFNATLSGAGLTSGLLVRTPITNDTDPDNGETFTLTATPTGGTAAVGTATIKDDGSGTIFTSTGAVDTVTAKNNDITVNNITVNEGSQYAVFTIDATQDQNLSLALASGTASGADYGSAMQYSLDGGTTWTTYTGAFNNALTGSGTTTGLLVRTTITNDGLYEMSEDFTLRVTATGGTTVVGTATITDDGSGTIFTNTGAVNSSAVKDDDRPVNPAFVNNVLVNEGSDYVVFTVTGVRSAQLTLALAAGTATSNVDYTNSLQYWNGSTWISYSPANLPSLDNTDGALKVRVPILRDTELDGGENFQLTVRYTGVKDSLVTSLLPDTSNAFVGNAIIVDDATGSMWNSAGNLITPASTAVVDVVANPNLVLADDDRPVTVGDIAVNEASSYAVFTVNGVAGQYVKLAVANGTADSADYGPGLEYYNGTAWATYIAGSYVQIPATGTTLLVRTAITNDVTYEGAETFTLSVFNTGGGSDQGVATIKDDGTGALWDSAAAPVTAASTTPFDPIVSVNAVIADDDRPLTVNDVTVNEASPYAVFTVSGAASQYVQLSVEDETATDADYSPNLEYYNGSTWLSYTVGNYVQIPASGTTLLVRTVITNDSPYEGAETFALTVFNTGGGSDLGIGTIKDDGTGSLFSASNTTGIADRPRGIGLPATLNDDRRSVNVGNSLPPVVPSPAPAPAIPLVRNIHTPQPIPKAVEQRVMPPARYEFNEVVLDFNGEHGGIGQFSLPHGETTEARDSLDHSNHTPYTDFDRLGDEIEYAQRAIDANLSLAKINNPELMALLSPRPKAKADDQEKTTIIIPKEIIEGAKGKGKGKLSALTADGRPLPAWMKFDPNTASFEVAMPDDFNDSIELQLIATDAMGEQAHTKFKIKPPVKAVDKSVFIGKSSLLNQIKSAVMLGRV